MIREQITRITRRLSDIVFHGRNKAMILLGTDRKDEVGSGYGDGGTNDVNSAIIDAVVGYGAEQTNPDYLRDKSRIYLAEKTDPDDYFGISLGAAVTEEPAIVQISDNIYLKARKKIKILNDNITILIDDNGEIEITSSQKASITVGSAKIILNSNGTIDLDASQGISGKIITDLDMPAHIDPITGATIMATFQAPLATPPKNQKITIK